MILVYFISVFLAYLINPVLGISVIIFALVISILKERYW